VTSLIKKDLQKKYYFDSMRPLIHWKCIHKIWWYWYDIIWKIIIYDVSSSFTLIFRISAKSPFICYLTLIGRETFIFSVFDFARATRLENVKIKERASSFFDRSNKTKYIIRKPTCCKWGPMAQPYPSRIILLIWAVWWSFHLILSPTVVFWVQTTYIYTP
jgi:hypothetical protein